MKLNQSSKKAPRIEIRTGGGWKDKIIPLVAMLFLLLTAFIYQLFMENKTIGEAAGLVIFFMLIYIAFIALYDLFNKRSGEYKAFLVKLEASINQLIQKQRFIDQATLDLIEKEAQDIWVVTTKLGSEIKDENIDLRKSVEENLSKNKYYTYFLPHPDNIYFDEVNRNLKQFKKLDLYNKYRSKISFIRLPMDTQFLLEEVVIYNPHMDEKKEDSTKGLNAFSFYESDEEETDSVHMKIEGKMIIHLRNRLEKYLESTGLRFAAERLLTEFSDKIEDINKIYIANLMNKTKIDNSVEYRDFINKLKKSVLSSNYISSIEEILSQYMDEE